MHVKICGLSNAETVAAAVNGGARYIGFVFFEKSPRCVTPELAAGLALDVPSGVCKVALLVNPTNAVLKRILDVVPIDMLQLHGEESPERVKEVREMFGLPVMKAVGIADASDLDAIPVYARVADQLLIDTKAPKNSDIPGGNGVPFDWALLKGRRWAVPWMLAGGLTTDNVAEAAQITGAQQIDLSSAVEQERGVKDPTLIKEFLDVAHA